jgi:hypothetical protein
MASRLIGILDEIIVRMVVAYTLRTAQFWRRQGSYVIITTEKEPSQTGSYFYSLMPWKIAKKICQQECYRKDMNSLIQPLMPVMKVT